MIHFGVGGLGLGSSELTSGSSPAPPFVSLVLAAILHKKVGENLISC